MIAELLGITNIISGSTVELLDGTAYRGLAAAMVGLVPFLGAATPFGWLSSVLALSGDDPLLAVALGDATSDAMKVFREVLLHAGRIPDVLVLSHSWEQIVTLQECVSVARIATAITRIALASEFTKFLACWIAVNVAQYGDGGFGGSLDFDFDGQILRWQPGTTFLDHAVTLDENLGLDVSSVGNLSGTSGGVEGTIGFHLADLHATSAFARTGTSAAGIVA